MVPLWHFPDEQAHFAQVAFIAEMGRSPNDNDEKDLTEEIRKSQELLGTERDNLGINKFTYHPEYKIEYTTSLIGKYESEITRLAQHQKYRSFVKREASRYPGFYYANLASVYRILYDLDLITRVFIGRIVQLIFAIGTVYFSYRIGRLIFGQESFLTYTLPILVSYQPMFSFVSAGINSDNIGNFVFTFYIWTILGVLKNNINLIKISLFLVTSMSTIYFKPQFIITIPIVLLVLAVLLRENSSREKRFRLILIYIFSLGLLLTVFLKIGYQSNIHIYRLFNNLNLFHLIDYFKSYIIPHAYREVLPWYWGIYDWLGVTYPRIVHRIINWTGLFSLFGFFIYAIRNRKNIFKWPGIGIMITVVISLLLVLGIYTFDYFEVLIRNIHLGVQGRYFFPAISVQMAILLIGFYSLFPQKIKIIGCKIVVGLMILLNFFALYVVSRTYYDLSSLQTFIIQASQYKPWFFKGTYLSILFIVYLISLAVFVIQIFKFKENDREI